MIQLNQGFNEKLSWWFVGKILYRRDKLFSLFIQDAFILYSFNILIINFGSSSPF